MQRKHRMSGESACMYLRVSTTQQAQHDLSIPDQRNQILAFAEQRGWTVVAEFVEPGASARDDQRPVLQDMMARALSKPPEFTRIIVHSMSRLFRDEMYYELYRRKLDKNGVQIVSITQDFGEGAAADLTRRIMALTDEINSVENAKHVRRTMMENARQNFWNGSIAPLGYRTVVAEVRGHKQKKRLEIDPEESELIKLIYRLYLDGDGTSGPLGIRTLTRYLNEHGHRTRQGKKFMTSFVGKILRDDVYRGYAWYNKKDSRTGVDRPREEWIAVSVPPIIDDAVFQRVQTQLSERAPTKVAPRLVNSPVLLTGVARCGCGANMVMATGKGGRYQYYRCAARGLTGQCDAEQKSGISTAMLDEIVLGRLMDQLLTPERVQGIVAEVAAKRKDGADDAVTSLGRLREQLAKTTKKLSNLINLLAEGTVEASEAYKGTVKQTETDVRRLSDQITAQERIVDSQLHAVSLDEAASFAAQLREKLVSSAPSMKKRIIRSFVSRVVVTSEEIVIIGAKSDLAEVVTGSR